MNFNCKQANNGDYRDGKKYEVPSANGTSNRKRSLFISSSTWKFRLGLVKLNNLQSKAHKDQLKMGPNAIKTSIFDEASVTSQVGM